MRVIQEITVGDAKVLVKELTLAELRAWLAESAGRTTLDLVDELFSEQDLLVSDIPFFSDISAEAIEGLAPSEMDPLVEKIREVNGRFFVTWKRRLEAVTGFPVIARSNYPEPLPG